MKQLRLIPVLLSIAMVLLASISGSAKVIIEETSEVSVGQEELTTGNIEKFVSISPSGVHLSGPAGTPIRATIQIIPEKKYPFNIKRVYAKSGKEIRFRVKTVKDPERKKRHVLFVENLKKEPGRYSDTIYIVTDSDIQPEITVKVYGNILGPTIEASLEKPSSGGKSPDMTKDDSQPTDTAPFTGQFNIIGLRFDSGSSTISSSSEELAQIAKALKFGKLKKARILIQGHTDNTGSNKSNLTLSRARAKTVMDILMNTYGIEKKRLSIKGLGDTKPITSNSTPSGRALNRRIEFVYLGDL